MSIVIQDHKDSLESIQRDGQIVYIVGPGILKSPGHPAGNQQYDRQFVIFNIAINPPYLFKIFNKDKEKRIEFLGEYRLMSHTIKMSFEGFRYYEYKMVRVKLPTPQTKKQVILE